MNNKLLPYTVFAILALLASPIYIVVIYGAKPALMGSGLSTQDKVRNSFVVFSLRLQ